LLCYRLGFLEVLVELLFSALRSHPLHEHLQLCFWPKGFHKSERVAGTCDGGLCEEFDDLLRSSEESLLQRPFACFAFFWWIHHIHQLLGGSLEALQLLSLLLLLLAQRLDLLKAVGELLFSIGDHLLQPLDIICTVIQHILHINKQLFFIR
jgi:hypothetical protein